VRQKRVRKIKCESKGEEVSKRIILFIFLLMIFSCKGLVREDDSLKHPSQSVQEQEEKAMEEFKVMLESTKGMRRENIVPLISEGYNDIIEKYPDSFLAEESYYRLMVIKLRDHYPPQEEEAERLYREYFRIYKKPRIGMSMNGDLARYYYDYKKWEKLASFTMPFMKEYVKTGKYGDTVFLFLYTEAKFHLKEYDEARRGYQIIKRNFAGKRDAKIAEERLEYIKSLQDAGK